MRYHTALQSAEKQSLRQDIHCQNILLLLGIAVSLAARFSWYTTFQRLARYVAWALLRGSYESVDRRYCLKFEVCDS